LLIAIIIVIIAAVAYARKSAREKDTLNYYASDSAPLYDDVYSPSSSYY
jgi:hypothetical protein